MQGSSNTEKDYNSEDVFYCKNCLSLRIMTFENNDYCDICGCTDIESTDIESWREMYKTRYGKEF